MKKYKPTRHCDLCNLTYAEDFKNEEDEQEGEDFRHIGITGRCITCWEQFGAGSK